MTTMLSAADAACSIYGLEITLENQLSALQQHKDAGLELCYVSQWRSHHCSRHVDKESEHVPASPTKHQTRTTMRQ